MPITVLRSKFQAQFESAAAFVSAHGVEDNAFKLLSALV